VRGAAASSSCSAQPVKWAAAASSCSATPVKCMMREEGIALMEDLVDADASCLRSFPKTSFNTSIHRSSQAQSSNLDELFGDSESNWEGQAAGFSALDNAFQDIEEAIQDCQQIVRAADAGQPLGAPSEEAPAGSSRDRPASKELPRSPLSCERIAQNCQASFREVLDSPVSDSPAGSPMSCEFTFEDEDDILRDFVLPPSKELPRSPTSKNCFRDPVERAAPGEAPLSPDHVRDALPSANLDRSEKLSEHMSNSSEEEGDSPAGPSKPQLVGDMQEREEKEKAFAMFNIFCTEGRDSRSWRKNDLRLIDIWVLPTTFGSDVHINWAAPNAALDQLERLVISGTTRASGPTAQERRGRLHGRQPSQQTVIHEKSRPMQQTTQSATRLPPEEAAKGKVVRAEPSRFAPPPRLPSSPHVAAQPEQRILPGEESSGIDSRYSSGSSSPRFSVQLEQQSQSENPCKVKLERKRDSAASAEADVKRWLQELRQDVRRDGGRTAGGA